MEEDEKLLFHKLYEDYKKANLISYGSPDQYQFRQNNLLKSLSEVILFPYLKQLSENQ